MNALEIQGVTKRYPKFCLDHVSFSIPEGCIVGLIGENGAGKTTLMKIILQFIRKNEGQVKILGRDTEKGLGELKEDLGIVLDEGEFPGCFTCKDVNRMMKKVYKNWQEDRFEELARRFDLPMDREVKALSKGNKMKLRLFAALAHDPKLLILDEATSGLDPVARDDLLDLLNEFTRDERHSILISSHIVTDLEKICDYIAFLHKGKLVFVQEKDLLKERFGMIRVSERELSKIPGEAIRGLRDNGYGAEVLVERAPELETFPMECPTIEEIMLFLTKEAVK